MATARERPLAERRAIRREIHDGPGPSLAGPKTVRTNVSSVLTRLCVPDRSTAIVQAREEGLGLE